MPRQARADYPGALHHVIVRGIERGIIFQDDDDRHGFVKRLGQVLEETATPCFAWALLPNHVHLLLVTGKCPVSQVMQRVLTGYAVQFNRRHHRSGHLFQNRYRSILCDRDDYLLELVRYIHLNPLRAGRVNTREELDRHPWCGHAVILGRGRLSWQEVDEVLGLFGRRRGEARRRYRAFVSEGVARGRRPDLTGGGLVRSLGGWREVFRARRDNRKMLADARILGGGEFVENVMKHLDEREVRGRVSGGWDGRWSGWLRRRRNGRGSARRKLRGTGKCRRGCARAPWRATGW